MWVVVCVLTYRMANLVSQVNLALFFFLWCSRNSAFFDDDLSRDVVPPRSSNDPCKASDHEDDNLRTHQTPAGHNYLTNSPILFSYGNWSIFITSRLRPCRQKVQRQAMTECLHLLPCLTLAIFFRLRLRWFICQYQQAGLKTCIGISLHLRLLTFEGSSCICTYLS